jgi:hypothetical protein
MHIDKSPIGTTEKNMDGFTSSFVPKGLMEQEYNHLPALKCWAIFIESLTGPRRYGPMGNAGILPAYEGV